ncbi:MAG: hypothetical protein NVS3B2_14730 [Ramlibacter sp.]
MMKKHLLSQAAALCLLAPAASFLCLPATAAGTVAAASATPQTHGLEVNADSGVAPGSQLRITLDATPGGRATARIPGIDGPIALKETSPGQYTGRYTVRRIDRIDPAAVIRVSFTMDQRTVVANYSFPPSFMAPVASAPPRPAQIAQAPALVPVPAAVQVVPSRVEPPVRDNRPPQIANLLPRQGEAVSAGPTLVSGSFSDAAGVGIDPQSVRIVVSGRDVTSLAQITPREFSFRDRLPPGRHTVEVTAADRAGNVSQKSWTFDVGSAVLGYAPASLPLTVVNYQNNATIGQGDTTIRGRTVPFATVHVRVDAIAPFGRRVDAGVAQALLSESVQADANGDFSFTFNPRYTRDNATSLPVPGTRYEVSITASRDNLSTESRLMLFQRG